MILPDELKRWPEDARAAYLERVAIMVVDGIVPVAEARKVAELRVRLEWERLDEPLDRPSGDVIL